MRPSLRSSNALMSFFIEYPKDCESIMTTKEDTITAKQLNPLHQ